MLRADAGRKLRGARWRKRLTLQQLAEVSGVNRETIRRTEIGLSEPREETIFRLASALDLDPEELLQGALKEGA